MPARNIDLAVLRFLSGSIALRPSFPFLGLFGQGCVDLVNESDDKMEKFGVTAVSGCPGS